MKDNEKENCPGKTRSILDGGITFFTIVAVVIHSTIGFFVYKAWEYTWDWWVKTHKKPNPPDLGFSDKKD